MNSLRRPISLGKIADCSLGKKIIIHIKIIFCLVYRDNIFYLKNTSTSFDI